MARARQVHLKRFCISLILPPPQFLESQRQLRTGKYRSAEEILEIALRLFDECDHAESQWIQSVRAKIDAAIEAADHTDPVDGETFGDGILDRFQSAD